MEKYTIYCTTEQTKKALELGAPIMLYKDIATESAPKGCFIEDNTLFFIPTAEQMILWLEEQGIMLEVYYNCTYQHYNYAKLFGGRNRWGSKICDSYIYGYSSRKEAILAAIDAALEYLSKNKK